MSGGAAGQPQEMRDFVSRLFQGSPNLSILTHAIIRKKYLDHVGVENLSKQEKEQLKQLVEEELVQMKVDQPLSTVELKTEALDSFRSGDHKRPLHISHSSKDKDENEKEQKRQKIEKNLEVSSDEKYFGTYSKKRQCYRNPKLLRMSLDSSDQGDSEAGNHSAESESDEETISTKRKPSLQEARWERRRGGKSPKGQGIGGSQKRRVSESEETDTGQSDPDEEGKERKKVTKGNSLKQKDFKKKVDKGSKYSHPKGKAKNRTRKKPRVEKNLSEGGTDLSEVEEISEKKRERRESQEKKSLRTNKAQQKVRLGTRKDSKRVEDTTSSEGESQSEMNQGQPRKAVLISPLSESESDEDPRRTLEKKSKYVSESDSSQEEEKLGRRGAQSKKTRGQPRKVVSLPSESESDESEDGDPRRTLEKEKKRVPQSDSRQGEKLKKSRAQKSQRKSIGQEIAVLTSEDSGSEFKGKKKIRSQQQRGTKKPQRRRATEEKEGEESSQEEGSSLEEDEPTTSQKHHQRKAKKHSGKNEEHPSIQRLKRYIRECGVRQNYKKLFAGCRSHKDQIKALKQELESLGVKGTPTLAKCKALKLKREEAAEMASLDLNNIIATEGRPKRKVWSLYNVPQESSRLPDEPTVRRHSTDWSQLRGIISSDGESS